jgi:hypothetical protein
MLVHFFNHISKLQSLNLSVVPSIKVLAAVYFDIDKKSNHIPDEERLHPPVYFLMAYLTTLPVTHAVGFIPLDMGC